MDVETAISAGTDVTIEISDMILVKNCPKDVSKVADLPEKAHCKMVQNSWSTLGYNIFAMPSAAGILYNFGMVVTPTISVCLCLQAQS